MTGEVTADGSIALGDVIGGRYRVEAVLGRGGMATVYRARHLATGKASALKLVHAHLVTNQQVVEMLLREAQLGARIGSNPHIVDIFDAGFDEARRLPFLAMELLEGDTLDRVTATRGPMPVDLFRELMVQLADALDQAHRAGVIHRDLKPTNLFLTSNRHGAPVLKVMDFGIAKVLELEAQRTATQVGTPSYAAPEQMGATLRKLAARQGIVIAQNLSPATDVWALGLVAYDLLTGLPPGQFWGVDAATELPTKIVLDDHEVPSRRAGDRARLLPPGFDAWFSRCTRRNASDRFATIGQAVAELVRLLPALSAPLPPVPPIPAQPVPTLSEAPTLHMGARASAVSQNELRGNERSGGRLRGPRKGEIFAALGIAAFIAVLIASFMGYRAYHLKKIIAACESSLATCQEACDAGDTSSCARLGTALDRGEGIGQDRERARVAYDRACSGGHLPSCARLAVLLASASPGTPADRAKAVTLYQRACDGGEALACLQLGVARETGALGLARDKTRAAKLFQKACEGGEVLACTSLGWLCETGSLGPNETKRAGGYYQRACDGGEMLGCARLAALLEAGKDGAPKDEARAVALFRKACEGFEMSGCLRLGAAYELGLGGEIKDEAAALALYQKACDGGEISACTHVGEMNESGRGGLEKDPRKAAPLYRRACDRGEAHACSLLGLLEAQGRGMPRDRTQGLEHLHKGCKGGDAWGCERAKELELKRP